jgi:hypothetical protein
MIITIISFVIVTIVTTTITIIISLSLSLLLLLSSPTPQIRGVSLCRISAGARGVYGPLAKLDHVNAVAASPDGNLLASADNFGKVRHHRHGNHSSSSSSSSSSSPLLFLPISFFLLDQRHI